MFVFTVICMSIISVKSPIRTDCYASLSIPVIYIKLSHYYPSGPLYFNASFSYFRSLFLHDDFKTFNINHHFKRYDHNCTVSILFSSLGYDLRKLNVEISLYLNTDDRFALIFYLFIKGFKPGVYKMFDYYQHFLLHTKVMDDDEDYLKASSPFHADKNNSYLRALFVKNNRLCVITEHNQAVVLQLPVGQNTNYSYITRFIVEITRNGTFIGTRKYPAFECNKDESYHDKPIMFITDGDDFNIDFYVIDITLKKFILTIHNPNIGYVYNLENIPQEYIKVFLMKLKQNDVMCQDGSNTNIFLSEYGKIYHAITYDILFISHRVYFSAGIFRSPFDICNENTLK